MAITSGFFNSIDNDRMYNAEDMTRYFEGLISSGVYANPSTNLQVLASSGMTVGVQTGRGMIDCHWVNNNSVYNITIPDADPLLDRIDAIVLNYNIENREITIDLKEGTPATNPAAPTLLRTANTQEYCLAQIYVATGTLEIRQSNITDTRADNNLCGWITNLVDNIDVGQLLTQWNAVFEERIKAFDEWYASLVDELKVETVIKKYENSYTTTEATTSFAIGIDEYEEGDALLLHLSGILLIENTDYTVENGNIILVNEVEADRTYTCIVFKSVVGNNA